MAFSLSVELSLVALNTCTGLRAFQKKYPDLEYIIQFIWSRKVLGRLASCDYTIASLCQPPDRWVLMSSRLMPHYGSPLLTLVASSGTLCQDQVGIPFRSSLIPLY